MFNIQTLYPLKFNDSAILKVLMFSSITHTEDSFGMKTEHFGPRGDIHPFRICRLNHHILLYGYILEYCLKEFPALGNRWDIRTLVW